jgi:hypothetical protein
VDEIKVLLAAKPMLNGLLRELLDAQRDIRVVESMMIPPDGPPDDELAARAAESGAQLVVLDELSPHPSSVVLLLEKRPLLKILRLTEDGRQGALCELRTQTTLLEDIWPTDLVEAIRDAALTPGWAEDCA